jgi:hypothetical protein
MKDEERFEYMQWRTERDIVRGKGGEPAPKPEAKKDEKQNDKANDKKEAKNDKASDKKEPKKPFTDRVLEKAVDYLKQEIHKIGAMPAVLEHKNA